MFGSKRRDSESSTDLDRQTNDCVMDYERGALVRGSDPPLGHRVHTVSGDMWWTLAMLMIKTQLVAGVHQTDDNIYFSISLEWQKIVFLFTFERIP